MRESHAREWSDRRQRLAWWLLLALALLGTVLLHGCHGEDEDHELFRGVAPESVWIVN